MSHINLYLSSPTNLCCHLMHLKINFKFLVTFPKYFIILLLYYYTIFIILYYFYYTIILFIILFNICLWFYPFILSFFPLPLPPLSPSKFWGFSLVNNYFVLLIIIRIYLEKMCNSMFHKNTFLFSLYTFRSLSVSLTHTL